jgi:hypothetical protein
MMDVARKSYLAGNAWTTNHCGENVDLDAGGSVTGIVRSSTLVWEIREQPSNQPRKEGTNSYTFVCAQPLTAFKETENNEDFWLYSYYVFRSRFNLKLVKIY